MFISDFVLESVFTRHVYSDGLLYWAKSRSQEGGNKYVVFWPASDLGDYEECYTLLHPEEIWV